MAQFTISRPVGTVDIRNDRITAEFTADTWKLRYWTAEPFASVEIAEQFIAEFLDWFDGRAKAVEKSGARDDILKPFVLAGNLRSAPKPDADGSAIFSKFADAAPDTEADDDNPF